MEGTLPDLKVLMLTMDFPPMDGGTAIFDQHICEELRRNGAHVEVLASNVSGAADFDAAQPYAVHRFPLAGRLSSIAPIASTVFHTLRWRPDVLFFGHMQSTCGLGAWLLWKTLRVPYVVLVHGFDLVEYWRQSQVDNFISALILKDAALIFANSEYTKRIVLERVGDAEGKITVINPGVDPKVFRPGLDTSAIKRQYGIREDRVILTASRLVPKKNHENVLRALVEVLKRIPNLKYLIVGKGPEEARLEGMVRELGLQEHVVFAGSIEHSQMAPYYCLSDIYVMPSCVAADNFESFGIVFAEASACSKPVIASKTGGISDAVVDGVTGLLVEPDNVDEIARALTRLLADEQLAATLGKNGRERVESELTWQAMGERIMASLRKMKLSTKDACQA